MTWARQGGGGEEEQTLHLKVITGIKMERTHFRPGPCPLLLRFMKSEVCGNGIPMLLPNPITSRAFSVAAFALFVRFSLSCFVSDLIFFFLFPNEKLMHLRVKKIARTELHFAFSSRIFQQLAQERVQKTNKKANSSFKVHVNMPVQITSNCLLDKQIQCNLVVWYPITLARKHLIATRTLLPAALGPRAPSNINPDSRRS